MRSALDNKYFVDQLQRISSEAIENIPAERGLALGISNRAKESNRSFTSCELTRQQFDYARSMFWQLTPDQVLIELDKVDVKVFPELEPSVRRMKAAAKAAGDWASAERELSRSQKELLKLLKQSITCNAKDISGVKETVFRQMLSYSRGRSYKRAAKAIQQRFPGLVAIDPLWLGEIANEKRVPGLSSLIPWWLWVVIIVLGGHLTFFLGLSWFNER